MIKFRTVFNFHDPDARGRTCALIFKVVEGFLVYINSGVFYTDFLRCYGMDSVEAGILTFIPYIAGMFVIFMPSLLNHFPKRRWILATCKILYYFCILCGMNLLAEFVKDDAGRLWGMILITFFASLFNIIATSGYAAWHIRFQPEEVRAYFLSTCLLCTSTVAGVLSLLGGWLGDYFESVDSAKLLTFLVVLRYCTFGLCVANVIFLLLPREVEYPTIRAPRFADIISIPLKNRKFMLTMLVVFLWQFSCYCYATQLNYYARDVIGMSLTYINLVILLYSVIFFLTTKFWQKMINKTSWFFVFAIALLIVAPFQIMYGFVTPLNYVWFVMIVRLPQHFAGVGHNTAFDNLQYINMPVTNRECYAAFYQIVFNLGALAGHGFGAWFDGMTKSWSYTVFGQTYTSGIPFLVMLCGVVQIVIAVFIFAFRKQLEPDKSVEAA
ncbi:MAG: MFS transporter [Clostridia bacterium]|nr:MFS transporter [Clostridia bacterium]